jgi:hypothetical protein
MSGAAKRNSAFSSFEQAGAHAPAHDLREHGRYREAKASNTLPSMRRRST